MNWPILTSGAVEKVKLVSKSSSAIVDICNLSGPSVHIIYFTPKNYSTALCFIIMTFSITTTIIITISSDTITNGNTVDLQSMRPQCLQGWPPPSPTGLQHCKSKSSKINNQSFLHCREKEWGEPWHVAKTTGYCPLSPLTPGSKWLICGGNILGRWTIVYTQKILKILYCRHTAGGRSCTSALNTSCLGHGREYTAVVISKGLMGQDLETKRQQGGGIIKGSDNCWSVHNDRLRRRMGDKK